MITQQQSTLQLTALDPSFNGKGIWHPQGINPQPDFFLGVTAQKVSEGGHLYFTGQAHGGVEGNVYVLGRLKSDGTLDLDFAKAANGIAHGNFAPGSASTGCSINLLDDGKILLFGLAGGRATPALGRFNSDGTLDGSYGPDKNGYVILKRPASQNVLSASKPSDGEYVTPGVVALSNGKTLVIHTYVVTHLADTSAFVFLLNRDGTLDTAFNQTGYLQVIAPGEGPEKVRLNNGFIDEKGYIVVCGTLNSENTPRGVFFARYTPQGEPDTTFNETGSRVFDSAGLVDATINSLISQTNNRLLAIGETSDGRGLLISLEPDGKDNIQFNKGEPSTIQLDNCLTRWTCAAMQPDGRIVLAGTVTSPDSPSSTRQSFAVLARLLSDGKEDLEFNADSFWTKARPSTHLTGVALQEDGKIVVAGFEFSTEPDLAVVMRFYGSLMDKTAHEGENTFPKRLTKAAPLDPSFGAPVGIVMLTTPVPGFITPISLALDQHRNIYVTGHLHVASEHLAYYCLRLTPAGTVDTSFNSSGVLIGDFVPKMADRSYSLFTAMFELDSGKLLLCGVHLDGQGNLKKGLMRLYPDGRVDTTYGIGGTKLIELGTISWKTAPRPDTTHANFTTSAKGSSHVLAGGKILLLTGLESGTKQTQSVVMCLMPDGEPDLGFDGKGWKIIKHPDFPYTEIKHALTDADGNYILGGSCSENARHRTHALFLKLLPSGALDTSFGEAGYVVIKGGEGIERFYVRRLVAQTNNRILGIGHANSTKTLGLLISLEKDGKFNIQFNSGAPLLTDLDGAYTSWCNAIIQRDGKILVSGLSIQNRCAVARFDDAGTLDVSYGDGGWLWFDAPRQAHPLQLFADGKLLFLARYNNEALPCIARGLID
ncbi:hypothetical protein J3P75_06585 [Pseudomonas sp. R1-1]|uniref:hypothetical protein n=1 Tax=Pseudomonas sp. R1-1 TaxID=1602529 RepID=UPI003DA90591